MRNTWIAAAALTLMNLVAAAYATTQSPTGTVAGQVRWTDGVASAGLRISAIEVTEQPREGQKSSGTHGLDWVPGARVAASAVTDNAGRFQIQNLVTGRYHIVAGPASLVKPYDDITTIGSTHYVTVMAGAVKDNVDFEMVRNSDSIPLTPGRFLTVTGVINMKRFDSAGGGLFIPVPNSDGSITYWNIRGGYGPGAARYWWPGYQPRLEYDKSPIADMVKAGEIVTITGYEPERWAGEARNVYRPLMVTEITRGGR